MNERPTPECNRQQFHRDNGHAREHSLVVSVEFARRLERQRDELLDSLTVIRTVASYPHHPNALHAIQSISKNAIAAGKEARHE